MTPGCIACANTKLVRFRRGKEAHWRCASCGLECVWPQPDDQTLASIYDASYFSHYAAEIDPGTVRAMKRSTYERQLRRLPSPIAFPRRPRLLDCGAASGYLVELAKDIGWDSFAVEFSGWGAQACSRLLGPDHVYRGQVQEASFAANPVARFDAITMFDFIEHVRDPIEVLEWAREHLDSEGVILLTTPRSGSISWSVMGARWFHYTQEHLWYFTPRAIQLLLAKAGFKRVNVYPAFKAITLGYALAHYSRKTTYSTLFSPPARIFESLLPAFVKAWRFWCVLGEMTVVASF